MGLFMARGNILLIDDDETVRVFLQDYFEDRDFNIEIASDGIEGVEKFEKGNFDLILCDILMPKMMGLEVLRRIKSLKSSSRIIMLTSVKEGSLMQKAKELGCTLYLNKPIHLTDLEAKVLECFPS